MVVGQSSRVQYLSTNVVENIHRPSTDAASEASSFEPCGEARVSKKVSSEKTLLPNHARKKAETLRDATGPRAWTRPRSGAERSARRAARARAGNARVSSESPRDRERRSIRAHRAFPAPRGSRHARRHRNCRRRRPRGCERGKEKKNHRGGVAIARAVVPLSCWPPRLSCAPRAASAPPRAPWRPPARAIPPRRPAGPRGPRPWRRAPRPRASRVGSKWAGKVSGAKVEWRIGDVAAEAHARSNADYPRGKSREGFQTRTSTLTSAMVAEGACGERRHALGSI